MIAVEFLILLPFLAAFATAIVAVATLLRRRPSAAAWCFFAGMVTFTIDSVFTGLSLRSMAPADALYWVTLAFTAKAFVPVFWVGFSLTYSRGNSRQFLARWRFALATLGLLPIVLLVGLGDDLFHIVPAESLEQRPYLQFATAARALNAVLLLAHVLILMNLEQTFRSAVGTMRWRIKFVVLAMTVIFGARLYVRSQAILYSAADVDLWVVESGALLLGCGFLAIAYVRTGLREIEVYPSMALVGSSLTLVIVGGYLFVVGVLAEFVTRIGDAETLQLQSLLVLLGLAGLAVLLLSDRARQRMHVFVRQHFSKAQHDSVRMWALFSRRLAIVKDEAGLCDVSARLVAETFDALSVTVWLLDEHNQRLVARTSTAKQPRQPGRFPEVASVAVTIGLRGQAAPFYLEDVTEPWAAELRRLNPAAFPNGGKRLCVPLRTADACVGALIVADRVNGAVHTFEEVALLQCIGEHMTSVLTTLRLGSEVARSREFEAFRTMSAFFVHDLKNAAGSLKLMLESLPLQFENPDFRDDALRAIRNTAGRIDQMIARLTALRNRPDFKPVEADLNQLIDDAIARAKGLPDVELTRELQPVPKIMADPDQIGSVVTNLLLNARDATGPHGRIRVRTEHHDGRVVLSVADNGCGMSEAFVTESLFRPFQSTKKKGLGIGLFQSRSIIETHGGGMHVETEPGRGTTFLVTLPVRNGE